MPWHFQSLAHWLCYVVARSIQCRGRQGRWGWSRRPGRRRPNKQTYIHKKKKKEKSITVAWHQPRITRKIMKYTHLLGDISQFEKKSLLISSHNPAIDLFLASQTFALRLTEYPCYSYTFSHYVPHHLIPLVPRRAVGNHPREQYAVLSEGRLRCADHCL